MTTAPTSISAGAVARIVAAWTNAIGASPEDAGESDWTFIERDDFGAVVVVQVDGLAAVAGPPRVMHALRDAPRESLLDAAVLARMFPGRATPIGTADLLFTERTPPSSRAAWDLAVPADMSTVRADVTSSEWEESGIGEAERRWTASAPLGGPGAIAGFSPWRSELAQMAVIARRRYRGRGLAYAAAAVATGAALDQGLIAQWRSRRGNDSSRALARQLGYLQLGVQSAVAVDT